MVSSIEPQLITNVGEVSIYRVEELIIPTSVRWLLPDAPRPLVEQARSWMVPAFMNEQGYILQSIHTYLLRTPDHVILVDTGVGNQKQRGGAIPAFNMLDTPFLERLAAAGVAPDDVDIVLCTHIHGDHVGWDTHLVDGRWTPTFANARHLFAEPEYAYWRQAPGADSGHMADSVRPVVDAGLADLVPVDYAVCREIRLEPSHGHSPGHVNICIESGGQKAVMIGDAMHTPLQAALPDVDSQLDRDHPAANRARRQLLERYADSGTLVLGAHFNTPCGGLVYRDGDVYRFEARSSG